MAGDRPKQDFSGDRKNKDTYDKDWVFHDGAWKTKRQRKSDRQDLKDRRNQRQASLAAAAGTPPAGAPPAPPTTAPILGGDPGMGRTPPVNIGRTPPPGGTPLPPGPPSGEPNPPSWWINAAIQNPTEEQQFANIANAILPTLAPEDQRTLGTYLAQNYKDVYGGYADAQFSPAPTEMNAEWRKSFLNPDRARLAVTLLEKMKTASGSQDMGAGYDYLKNAVNLMNQFATGGVMTREKYQQFSAAVSNLGKNATGNLAPYGNLAQLFNLPSFSAGPLVSNTPNNKLFS